MIPSIDAYIFVALTLFIIGALGLVLRRNLIIIFMCIELMLNAINLLLVAFSKYNNNFDGQVMVFFIMVIAACEAAVGLALVISLFKHFKSIDIKDFKVLRG